MAGHGLILSTCRLVTLTRWQPFFDCCADVSRMWSKVLLRQC